MTKEQNGWVNGWSDIVLWSNPFNEPRALMNQLIHANWEIASLSRWVTWNTGFCHCKVGWPPPPPPPSRFPPSSSCISFEVSISRSMNKDRTCCIEMTHSSVQFVRFTSSLFEVQSVWVGGKQNDEFSFISFHRRYVILSRIDLLPIKDWLDSGFLE